MLTVDVHKKASNYAKSTIRSTHCNWSSMHVATDNDAGHHDTFGLDKALQCLELSSRYRRLRLRLRLRRPVRV